MNTGARLGIFGLGLALAFGTAFGIGGAVMPGAAVVDRTEGNEMNGHDKGGDSASTRPASTAAHTLKGLALSADGYVLSPIEAPPVVGEPGALSFQIQDASGTPVTEYTTAHDKELHLIVARSDGRHFRHVHPVLDMQTGTWTTPWQWDEAGSYRVFADFTPGKTGASGLTLTRAVHVAGEYTPVSPQLARVDEVAGLTVSIDGDLVAGLSSALAITITRDGAPVTTVEPYLGAFGHLVALRDGDLAFLHVHAEGESPQAGDTAGPKIVFAAEAPTAGRYLLYLDFKVNGEVHTAEFVLDASHGDGATGVEGEPHVDDGH
jgi:hypothetical protein